MRALSSRCLLVMMVAALVTAGCAASTPTQRAALDPASVSGEARLPEVARPVGYELAMQVDPASPTFSGRVTIEVEVLEATDVLRLHAQDLTIKRVEVRQGGAPIQAEAVLGSEGGLALALERAAEPGRLTVVLDWEGALTEVPSSLYRVEVDGRWYAFTQFEPLEARAAFPCFDEPGFKVPIALQLTVPKGLVAAANTPIIERRDEGEASIVRFEATPPMPTYLVAIAVGEFDVTEAPAGAIGAPPLRILSTKGSGALTQYALERTPVILSALERWFGTPYPYKKLDLVAVPNFTSGAMENAGLVTFREQLLLLDPANTPARQLRGAQSVIAHELAHMWFGDLVTMAWWDDLWLNEAFATWMASHIMAEVAPEFEEPLRDVSSKGEIMQEDARDTATPIKKIINNSGDIRNAFDGITYAKGAAVLRMLEAWLGPEAFQTGVRRYLQDHAWGNATEADLMRALDAASGQDVTATAKTFIRQAGVPMVEAKLVCDGSTPPRVLLSQRRTQPIGGAPRVSEAWRVPVCVRYGGDGGEGQRCGVLEGASSELPLQVATCPTWIYPNADELGYYRWTMAPEALQATFQRGNLHTSERLALTNHLLAWLEGGLIDGSSWLDLLAALGAAQHPQVVQGVIDALNFIDPLITDTNARSGFARLTRSLLADDAGRIGVTPKPGESVDAQSLRGELIPALARYGQDEELRAQTAALARTWLADPDALTADVAGFAVPLAAERGDAALWELLLAAFKRARTPAEQRVALNGLGSFSDPALLERSLNLLLDGTVRAQDYWALVWPTNREPATYAVFWGWFTRSFDKLVELRGPRSAGGLPWAAAGFCDAAGRRTAETFFQGRLEPLPGADQNLAKALESVDRCILLRERLSGALGEGLKRQQAE